MQTLEAIIAPFSGLTFDQMRPVAEQIGVPHGTLYRVVKGYTKNPRYRTLEKMAAYSPPPPAVTPFGGPSPD